MKLIPSVYKCIHQKEAACSIKMVKDSTLDVKLQVVAEEQQPDKRKSLLDVIGDDITKENLEYFLTENTPNVNEKGLNGETPLHKAVQNKEIEIIELLLQHKADPNHRNESNVTPFHYSCKRGDIRIINLLIQNGADLRSVDSSGKGPIHHAAFGGSVYALHYLTEVHGLSTHVKDSYMNTPLHEVSALENPDNIDALNYLLRQNRSDIYAKNSEGNNALHIAAYAAQERTCYRLTEEGGLPLLHEFNWESNLPVNIASILAHYHGYDNHKYCDTRDLLNHYTNFDQCSGKLKEGAWPWLLWYFNLLLPFVVYPLVLLVAYQIPFPSVVFLVGMGAVAFLCIQQSHRIDHICRWPNPIFCSMFTAGILHSMICYYFQIMSSIYVDEPILVQIMPVWNVIGLVMYCRLLTMDPGIIGKSVNKPGTQVPYTIRDIAEGNIRPKAFCSVCEIIPPLQTYHCKICNVCHLRFDHHCLFLYRCIARDNHRLFIIFVITTVMGMLMFLYTMAVYFCAIFMRINNIKDFAYMFYVEMPWEVSLFAANCVAVFWCSGLIAGQLDNISKAQTETDQIKTMGITTLNAKQRIYNIIYYLMGKGFYKHDDKIEKRIVNVLSILKRDVFKSDQSRRVLLNRIMYEYQNSDGPQQDIEL